MKQCIASHGSSPPEQRGYGVRRLPHAAMPNKVQNERHRYAPPTWPQKNLSLSEEKEASLHRRCSTLFWRGGNEHHPGGRSPGFWHTQSATICCPSSASPPSHRLRATVAHAHKCAGDVFPSYSGASASAFHRFPWRISAFTQTSVTSRGSRIRLSGRV